MFDAAKQFLEQRCHLQSCQVLTQARVRAETERQVPDARAIDSELEGIVEHGRVTVG